MFVVNVELSSTEEFPLRSYT